MEAPSVAELAQVAQKAYHDARAVGRADGLEAWRSAVTAVLGEAAGGKDWLVDRPSMRAALLDASEVEYVDDTTIRAGMGPGACSARYSENPNWVLEHAANALALYRVMVGDQPRPKDPKAAELERMAAALDDIDDISFSGPVTLAKRLQEAGFTLAE